MNESLSDSTSVFQEQVTGLLRWPPFDETLSIIALALAFSIFIIAYFAGGAIKS